MKLKPGFILKKTAGRYVAVSIGENENDFNGIITLSGSAPFYWELLKSEQTLESLVAETVKEYDVSKEEAKEGLLPFLKKLSDAGIIDG